MASDIIENSSDNNYNTKTVIILMAFAILITKVTIFMAFAILIPKELSNSSPNAKVLHEVSHLIISEIESCLMTPNSLSFLLYIFVATRNLK